MARNREALVFLLDVSPSMHNLLPDVSKLCHMIIERKFFDNKSDEVAVVLFGTQDTNNELEKEVGGYEHVVVVRAIKVIADDIFEVLSDLPRGTTPGDFLDAIVVGMDLLIKKFGPTNKGKKRLCLVTNAQHPIKEPDEGTKDDQIDALCEQLKAHGMKLECIVARGKFTGVADKRIVNENDYLLSRFSGKGIARTVFVEDRASLLGAIQTRTVSPVTIFRGDLELSNVMKIKVWVYKKSVVERFPTLKKYSDKAPPNSKFSTHEVKVDFEYKSKDNPNNIVPPEQRIRGYRYGPQVVPISSAELEALKFKPEKGIKLLGFTNASNIRRHQYMRDTYVFIPEPGNRKAILAVSTMARAMKNANKVSILRCVWRQGQGNVVVGVLTPNLSSSDNIPDSFYFNILPFAEDVREFHFPSFNKLPLSRQPNEKQQGAADNLVKMLDLVPSGKGEALRPEVTPNPVLERFYRFVELKTKQPDAAVPPLDESLVAIVKTDPELISQNKSVISSFRSQFQLKPNPKKKSAKLIWGGKPLSSTSKGITTTATSIKDDEPLFNAKQPTELPGRVVNAIGYGNGIEDFKAMMARTDGEIWILKATREMKNYISTLVKISRSGSKYTTEREALVVFRKGCVDAQKSRDFNELLRELKGACKEECLKPFWEHVMSEGITLISKKESFDSDVSEEDAKDFLVKDEMLQ